MANCTKIERIIIRQVNQARHKRGLGALRSNKSLTKIARDHSARMARTRKIWHGNGVHKASKLLRARSSWDFVLSLFNPRKLSFQGYSGENVGLMHTGRVRSIKFVIRTDKEIATALHRNWMRSPGHKANILNSKFKAIGVGVKQNKTGYYSTELFYG